VSDELPQERDLEATRQWLSDRPLATSIGIDFTELTPGRCVGEWRPDPEWLNPNGSLPGAMMAAFADHIAGSAALSTIGTHDYTATVELDMRFIRAAFKAPITGVATIVRRGRRLAFISIEMRDPDDTLVADGTALFFIESRLGKAHPVGLDL